MYRAQDEGVEPKCNGETDKLLVRVGVGDTDGEELNVGELLREPMLLLGGTLTDAGELGCGATDTLCVGVGKGDGDGDGDGDGNGDGDGVGTALGVITIECEGDDDSVAETVLALTQPCGKEQY